MPLPTRVVRRSSRVEVPEHRLAFEEGALPGVQVDVEDRAGCRPRLDDDLDRRLPGLGVVAEPDRVHGGVDGDVPAGGVPRVARRVAGQHPQCGQAAAAQGEHGCRVEGVDGDEPLAVGRGQERNPLLVARRVDRRPGEVCVRGVGVVDDEQPVTGRLDVVLDALAAGRDDAPLPIRVRRVQQVHLGRRLGPQAQHEPALVAT
jgi:hypothetical protein